MKEVRVTRFSAADQARVRRIMRSMGFRISSRRMNGEIAANPAGARQAEVADLARQLRKLDRKIRVAVHDL
jgi:hypothetical protein